MHFVLTVACNNPAFADNPEIELARILREAATKISEQAEFKQQLYDINGNRVGLTLFGEEPPKDQHVETSSTATRKKFPKRY